MKMTYLLSPVVRLKICGVGAIPPLPYTSSLCADILSTGTNLSYNHDGLDGHNHSVMDFAILWLKTTWFSVKVT
jgi:hypothetical protein